MLASYRCRRGLLCRVCGAAHLHESSKSVLGFRSPAISSETPDIPRFARLRGWSPLEVLSVLGFSIENPMSCDDLQSCGAAGEAGARMTPTKFPKLFLGRALQYPTSPTIPYDYPTRDTHRLVLY